MMVCLVIRKSTLILFELKWVTVCANGTTQYNTTSKAQKDNPFLLSLMTLVQLTSSKAHTRH